MTDYWKSGERHFCTFCKCWLAGNKLSINLHESGNHHKSMVRTKVEQLRKDNVEKERQSKQLSDTLGEMERAANESFRRDMVNNAMANADNIQASTSSENNLPSKLKRPLNQPVQVQVKKPKFVIKTPTPKPVYEPIATPVESEPKEFRAAADDDENESVTTNDAPEEKEESVTSDSNPGGTWYESKTDNQESFYWNDITGESTWTPPAEYLSIAQQRAKGLKI